MRRGRSLGVAIAMVGFAGAAWFELAFLAVAGAADFVSAVLRSNILLAATPDAEPANVRASIVSDGVLTVVGTVVVAAAIPALVRYDARRPQDE